MLPNPSKPQPNYPNSSRSLIPGPRTSSKAITRSCARCSRVKRGRNLNNDVQGYSFAEAQTQLEQALKNSTAT